MSTSGQNLDRQTRALTEADCIRIFADKSGKTARSSCGFCEVGRGQVPGRCYDDHGRGKGTYYGARPAFNLGRGLTSSTRPPGA